MKLQIDEKNTTPSPLSKDLQEKTLKLGLKKCEGRSEDKSTSPVPGRPSGTSWGRRYRLCDLCTVVVPRNLQFDSSRSSSPVGL